MQTSDWSARPLSPEQIAYAVNDVWYLGHIAAHLAYHLDQTSRLHNAVKISQLRTRCSLSTLSTAVRGGRDDALALLRRMDQAAVSERSARRLYALCQWRDAQARRRNCGVQLMLPDDVVLRIAGELGEGVDGEARSLQRVLANPPPWDEWRVMKPVGKNTGHDKQRRLARLVDKFSAKAPVYDNCRMLRYVGFVVLWCCGVRVHARCVSTA